MIGSTISAGLACDTGLGASCGGLISGSAESFTVSRLAGVGICSITVGLDGFVTTAIFGMLALRTVSVFVGFITLRLIFVRMAG